MKNKNIFLFSLLPVLFLATRLANLKIIPIFTDEAIYGFWTNVALNDPVNRYISLEDGKQPLFIWFAAVIHKFVADPLIALRLTSVFAGLGSIIGIFLLSDLLFKNKKLAACSSFLYILLPFTLLYDRMGIYDSLLAMFGIYAVYFSVKMAKTPQLDLALLNGFAIGAGLITKSSAAFFLYLLPFSLFLFDFTKKNLQQRLLRWAGFSLVTFVVCQLMYNSLRLSPLFYIIKLKNYEFIRSPSEVLKFPLQAFYSNFTSMTGWLIGYIGPILFFVFLVGTVYGLVKRDRKVIYLTVLVAAPFIAEVIFNKILYARFLLFFFPYVIILLSFSIFRIYEKLSKYHTVALGLFIIALLYPTYSSVMLLFNPPKAIIPQNDKNQYINDWPAGYGVSSIVNFLKDQTQTQEVYVGTEGTFGLYPYALTIYLQNDKNLHVFAYWPVSPNKLPEQVIGFAKTHKTYFIFNQTQTPVTDPHVTLVSSFRKGSGESYMRLFEIKQ